MIDPAVFRSDAVSEETRRHNEVARRSRLPFPPVSGAELRAVHRAGLVAASGGRLAEAPDATTMLVRAEGREIPLRLIGRGSAGGLYVYLHGGGWTIGGADLHDAYLAELSAASGRTVASVEYRLAPEHPFPGPLEDCIAATRWLIANAENEFGTTHVALGGGSAGSNLALATALALRDEGGGDAIDALSLGCGAYDLTLTPSARNAGDREALTTEMLEWFSAQYVPAAELRTDPRVSPLYADLRGLPPVLLIVGTNDPLLDDSLFLYARLVAAGVRCSIEIGPGGGHSFDAAPIAIGARARARIADFLARTREPAAV